MNCPKCNGLTIKAWMNDANYEGPAIVGWRCVICGFLGDQVVIQHYQERQLQGVCHE